MRRLLKVLVVSAVLVGGGVAATSVTDALPAFHCNQVNLHPNSLPNGQETVVYGPGVMTLTPNSLAIPIQSYAVAVIAGSLPSGLTLVPWGGNQAAIIGTPVLGSAAIYTFTVQIGGTYVLGTICNVTKTYTIVITP